MADLGVVGQDGQRQAGSYLGRSQVTSEYAKVVICTTITVDPLYIGYYAGFDVTAPRIMQGRDNVFGNPTPAQKVSRPGFYTTLVPVTAGYHVIAIDYLLIDPDANNDPNPLHNAIAIPPFPRLTIKANPEVGLLQDLTADATAGDGVTWRTLSIAFTATANGVIKVIREKRYMGMDDSVFWDNLRMLA